MAEGFPTVEGGLLRGLLGGVQSGLQIGQLMNQSRGLNLQEEEMRFNRDKFAMQQEEMNAEMERKKREEAKTAIEKSLEVLKSADYPESFQLEIYNKNLVPNAQLAYGINLETLDKYSPNVRKATTQAGKIIQDMKKGVVSENDGRAALAAVIAEFPTQVDLVTKQAELAGFPVPPPGGGAEGGARAGGKETMSDLKLGLLKKYLAQGANALTPHEKTIIDSEINNPLMTSVISMYMQNLQNIGKPTTQQLQEINSIVDTAMNIAQKNLGTVPSAAPAQIVLPMATAGAMPGGMRSYGTQEEAEAGIKRGEYKIGDKLIIGGRQFIAQ